MMRNGGTSLSSAAHLSTENHQDQHLRSSSGDGRVREKQNQRTPVSIRHQNVSQDTIYFNVLLLVLLLLARGFHCRLLFSAAGAAGVAGAVEADSAIQTEHTYPLYLSVLFNAQQRSDVSCARFLKCTIIPSCSYTTACYFCVVASSSSSSGRVEAISSVSPASSKKDACTIHSFALGGGRPTT